VTLVGPYIHNITDDIEYLEASGGARVTDESGLADLLSMLARNRAEREKIGERAIHAVRHRKGIAARCVDTMADRGLLP
jgi:3-deoxy-D-manno-octulosonic-acid transferase